MTNFVTIEKVEIDEFTFKSHPKEKDNEKGNLEVYYRVFDHQKLENHKMVQINFELTSDEKDENDNPMFDYKVVMNCYAWSMNEWNEQSVDIVILQSFTHLRSHLNAISIFSTFNPDSINIDGFVEDFKKQKLNLT